VRVVQAHISGCGTGDGGVEDVWMPKHAGERKEPTVGPAPDGDPAEIKVAALLGGTLERRDLVAMTGERTSP